MNNAFEIKTAELFENVPTVLQSLFSTFEYPWQILSEINGFILSLIEARASGYELIAPFVLAGKDVKIAPTAVIEGCAVIGQGSEIRHGAYLRGGVFVGDRCVVGNSTELKNCILTENVQVPHYNYVGDSILGRGSHMGSGAICSNLKADGKNVVIHCPDGRCFETGKRKMGAFVGDGADIGCGCVLSPGSVIGNNTSVYPLTHVRGVIPSESIVKSPDKIVKRI